MKFIKIFGTHDFSLTNIYIFGDILRDTLASINTMCRWHYNEDEGGREREGKKKERRR